MVRAPDRRPGGRRVRHCGLSVAYLLRALVGIAEGLEDEASLRGLVAGADDNYLWGLFVRSHITPDSRLA
ncbi:hypothetical protein ACFXPS_04035 [Nocardia sp. NPDC059091]|uniref:hypothetical protein n=1 Tax=unclassified Nocardia TaxID=2637762 RepID=UPI0036AB1B62